MGDYQRDDLYDRPQAVVDFRFDERTAAVFPDMIHRSVPGYATLLQLLAVIGADIVPPGGRVYDLGCALGGTSIALQQHMTADASIIAVDNSAAMTDRLAAYIAGSGIANISVEQADITTLELAPADLVLMTLTLQFIPPDERDALLKRIRCALRPGARCCSPKNPARTTTACAAGTKPSKPHRATHNWRSHKNANRWNTSCKPTATPPWKRACTAPASAASSPASAPCPSAPGWQRRPEQQKRRQAACLLDSRRAGCSPPSRKRGHFCGARAEGRAAKKIRAATTRQHKNDIKRHGR